MSPTETGASGVRVIGLGDLPATATARELVGADHGGAGVCLIFVESPPGGGPALHRHPYEEVFVVQEGEARFTAAGEERIVRGGEIVIVPAGVAHGFVNCGEGPLRQIDIHVNDRFDTEWLDG